MWTSNNPEIIKIVEEMRKAVLRAKPAQQTVAAFQLQNVVLKRIEDKAIAWADEPKSDIRTVTFELELLRNFRAMLRGLPQKPTKRKKKT